MSSRCGTVFGDPPNGDDLRPPSPSRGTVDLVAADDAARRRGGDNDLVSTTQRDQIDELADVAARAAKHAQRVLEGSDGPLAFALVLGLIAMTEVTISADEVGPAMIANLLATLPLALARRRISWVTGTIVFGVLFAIATDGGTLTIAALLGLVIALYLFAARYGRRWAVVPAVPFLLNAIVPLSGEDAGISGVLLLMVVVAALALGDSRRQRGEALAERDETRQAMVDTLQDQAAMGERARIARDLHDVVAHHVSAIAVQAESARLTTEGLPDEGRAHFEAIGQTARDALTEMRRLLGVLREDANAEATRDPQPSLARLNDLVETARAAGTPVTLTLEGTVTPLPTGVDLCAYRILQEALTNVRRHAPGAAVDVELTYTPEKLHLRVRDHGPGPAEPDPDGHGLLGMRERATMVGGTLTTGPAEGGGFAVDALLPVTGTAA
jgi:signal transduction histidine kinase